MTLVELIVAMVVAGIVLSLIASVSVHQQRIYSDRADADALSVQLRDAAAILPIDLRGAASSAGDIRNGEASDTAIEIRATIGSAVACDTNSAGVVLAPSVAGAGTYANFLTPIQVGDTAWIYSAREARDEWRPFRIRNVSSAAPGHCAPLGPTLDGAERLTSRIAIAFDDGPPLGEIAGLPMRFTRPLRYSLYRAADGAWYLGERDWNNGTARFNFIQPVAGPFVSASQGGLSFAYLDTVGAPLATPVVNSRAISLITLVLRGETKKVARELSAAGPLAKRSDSVSLMVLLRNRR